MIPSSIQTLELGTITMGENPRLPSNLDIDSLVENIGDIGLLEPIHVWFPNGDDVSEVIRGHRRTMALVELEDRNPKRFSELFPDGIPAIVWDDITAEEALILKLDHGGQVTLSDPHELQMSATLMFRKGFTEAQVANQLKPLIMKLSPKLIPSMASDLKKLEAKLAEARESGKGVSEAENELAGRIANGFRGRVQHLHNVSRCPDIVNASLFFKACDIKPEGFKDEHLPKLTTDQVKALWKAHSKDLEELDAKTGAPKFNKQRVGPLFVEKWKEILQKEAEAASGNKPAKDKAMSGKDMKSEITDGKWQCVGFYKLTKWHSGDKSVEGLETLDREYKALDLVKQFQPDLYEMVVAEASKIEAGLKAEATKEEGAEG